MVNHPSANHRRRHGLTLVEMMVSVVLTLMVVFALVRVFEMLGDNVTDGRATIEMSGNLRAAAQLLREDLAGLTVTTLPPRSPDQGEGYLEIVDGPTTDSQHFVQTHSGGVPGQVQLVSMATQASYTDINSDGFLDAGDIPYDTSVGDVDDVLAFTTRRPQQPFTGVIADGRIKFVPNGPSLIPNKAAPTLILESAEAEIVWWLQVERNLATTDLNEIKNMTVSQQIANATSRLGSLGIDNEASRVLTAQRYPNLTNTTLGTPVRSLHRRVLLIRPDLDLSNIVLKGEDAVAEFLSNNDISVRVIREDSSQPATYRVEANTLGDLSVRRNRAYRPINYWVGLPIREQPRSTRISDVRGTTELLEEDSLLLRHASMKDMVLDFEKDGSNEVIMLRKGKDVVLSDVLAFDVQVWDPQAIVRVASDGTAVSPSDPGYLQASVNGTRGAYVDLGFGIAPKLALPTTPVNFQGMFGGQTHAKSDLPIHSTNARFSPIYCTWSSAYEYDGFDQDKNDIVDQGNNGFDDNNAYGVDDPGEAETSPPYPHPIRGLSVKMRIMDFSTRQVRQTSVVTDFLPE